MTENDGLKREIGIWGLVSNSINIVVGAGIFVLPAIVAAQLGTAAVLAYAMCGVLCEDTKIYSSASSRTWPDSISGF